MVQCRNAVVFSKQPSTGGIALSLLFRSIDLLRRLESNGCNSLMKTEEMVIGLQLFALPQSSTDFGIKIVQSFLKHGSIFIVASA